MPLKKKNPPRFHDTAACTNFQTFVKGAPWKARERKNKKQKLISASPHSLTLTARACFFFFLQCDGCRESQQQSEPTGAHQSSPLGFLPTWRLSPRHRLQFFLREIETRRMLVCWLHRGGFRELQLRHQLAEPLMLCELYVRVRHKYILLPFFLAAQVVCEK